MLRIHINTIYSCTRARICKQWGYRHLLGAGGGVECHRNHRITRIFGFIELYRLYGVVLDGRGLGGGLYDCRTHRRITVCGRLIPESASLRRNGIGVIGTYCGQRKRMSHSPKSIRLKVGWYSGNIFKGDHLHAYMRRSCVCERIMWWSLVCLRWTDTTWLICFHVLCGLEYHY